MLGAKIVSNCFGETQLPVALPSRKSGSEFVSVTKCPKPEFLLQARMSLGSVINHSFTNRRFLVGQTTHNHAKGVDETL